MFQILLNTIIKLRDNTGANMLNSQGVNSSDYYYIYIVIIKII